MRLLKTYILAINLVGFGLVGPSFAIAQAMQCSQVLKVPVSHNETMAIDTTLGLDKIVSEKMIELSEKIKRVIETPGGSGVDLDVADILFAESSALFKQNGELIQSQVAAYAEIGSSAYHKKAIMIVASNEKNLLKLSELVAQNKSLKNRLLNLIPGYTKQKIETLSAAIRDGGGELNVLLKKLIKESRDIQEAERKNTFELVKLEVSQDALMKTRDLFQDQLWSLEQESGSAELIQNYKLTLTLLEKEINGLATLVATTTAWKEKLKSHLQWNQNAIAAARDVLIKQPVIIAAVVDRTVDLRPDQKNENGTTGKISREEIKRIGDLRIIMKDEAEVLRQVEAALPRVSTADEFIELLHIGEENPNRFRYVKEVSKLMAKHAEVFARLKPSPKQVWILIDQFQQFRDVSSGGISQIFAACLRQTKSIKELLKLMPPQPHNSSFLKDDEHGVIPILAEKVQSLSATGKEIAYVAALLPRTTIHNASGDYLLVKDSQARFLESVLGQEKNVKTYIEIINQSLKISLYKVSNWQAEAQIRRKHNSVLLDTAEHFVSLGPTAEEVRGFFAYSDTKLYDALLGYYLPEASISDFLKVLAPSVPKDDNQREARRYLLEVARKYSDHFEKLNPLPAEREQFRKILNGQ